MNNKLPTIKEIAKRLNVAVSTVSRALSNHPRIGLRTKTRVQQLAAELGYEPNAKAISFKQKKSFVVGVVLPYIREEFFSQAISGIDAAAMESHYTILFGQSYDDEDREKIVVETMRKQQVDGLLISLSKQTTNYDHLRRLEKYNIPVVYFDRVPPFEKANKVYCNLYNGTVEMVAWLISKGYKRIALINGPDKLSASKERMKGFIEGHFCKKLKVDMCLVERTDLSKEGTQAAMKILLGLRVQPQAIISFNEYVHMDAVQFFQHHRPPTGKEIAFGSFANLPITNYTSHPPLVSVEQHPYRQGQKAMQILIGLLNEKKENESLPEKYRVEEIAATLMVYPDGRV